jgi:hypothetical protein
MPTHYHLLILPVEFDKRDGFLSYLTKDRIFHPLVRKIGSLQSSFSRTLNNEMNDTGSRFQQKAKSKMLDKDEDYPVTCFHYIHQNPLRAKIVKELGQWEFSSYRDFAGLRDPFLVDVEKAIARLDLPTDKARFIHDSHKLIPDEFNISMPMG